MAVAVAAAAATAAAAAAAAVAAQPKKPLAGGGLAGPELEFLLSQEGRKEETRCMAGGEAPLSVVAAVAWAKTRRGGSSARSKGRPSKAADTVRR
ncbi:hypothetical protein UVI_02019790 [Ustilaginoidea virens]|uniref:Secreted protein n=1 Tax=Ustilaginoidea virens TaxID=1159556 RepID=A0A1B5KZN6_USTVR|nr:hypothetical protein UVI_02019790 [Ustilaginoidea virens]